MLSGQSNAMHAKVIDAIKLDPKQSDYTLAKQCGTSPMMVWRMRRVIGKEAQPEVRISRSGKVMQTKGISLAATSRKLGKPRPARAAPTIPWPDVDAEPKAFAQEVFLFGTRDVIEIGKQVRSDLDSSEFLDYRILEAAATEAVATWTAILDQLKQKAKRHGEK